MKRRNKGPWSTGKRKKGGRAGGRARVSERAMHFHNFQLVISR